MAYMVINKQTLEIVHFGGGLTESAIFKANNGDNNDYTEAVEFIQGLTNMDEFEVIGSHEYNARLGNLVNLQRVYESLNDSFNRKNRELESLRGAIEAYIEDRMGDLAVDQLEFMDEVKDLAEAIGYEFTEQREFSVTVNFTATVKRGYEVEDWDFDIDLTSNTGEVTDVEVTSQELDY